MFKITLVLVMLAVVSIIPLRIGVSTGGFFREGIVEGVQSCNEDSDCVWVPTGCCGCKQGGGEMLINKEKEWIYSVLVKEICLGEQYCSGTYACSNDEVYCERTCKTGKKTYTKPLLAP